MAEETKPKVDKKLIANFTAGDIDSIAPVKKILDELQVTNPQAYAFYCQNMKQRHTTQNYLNNYHFVVPGYPLNAFDDNWDGELNLDYFEPFPYKSLPPKMITSIKNIQETDPVASFMEDKMQWRHTCRTVKLAGSFSNLMQKYKNLNEEVVQCPKHMVDIAAHLDSDPDPYFDSPYNWYYAGNGNLQLICIDWVEYLLHSEFTSMYLTEFYKNDLNEQNLNSVKSVHIATFDCGKGKNILETIYSSQNIIVLRTKYNIFILKLKKIIDEILFETLKCIGSELPYTSISFDKFHKNILYITTLDNNLKIVNLDRLKARSVKLKGNVTTLLNNWNTVIGSDRGVYTHAGRNSISIYDKRSNNVIHVWKGLRGVTDEIACNDISVAKHLEDGKSLYFGTDHHLFKMDVRFCQNQNAKVVQRWTHGMECVPAYLKHCNFQFNKDLICLSSQWCEDMCVVPNYNNGLIKETHHRGVTIPYRPPSILGALNEARQQMLCHDLYNPIDGRLCASITGLLVMELGEKYVILMQNSLGDISCHNLVTEHYLSFVEDDSAQSLHDWSAEYKLEKKDFEVSSIENIASVWKQLRKVPDDFRIEDNFFKQTNKFNEKEIADVFENEEVDVGLQEVWEKGLSESAVDEPVSSVNLHCSDEHE